MKDCEMISKINNKAESSAIRTERRVVIMTNLEQKIKDEMKSKVYNALSDIMYDYADYNDIDFLENSMEEALEWFIIRFFEDNE